jgi:heptosyltransferase I
VPTTSLTTISAPPQRLLLTKLSSLGDVVHALALVESLRLGLGPQAFIGWAVRQKFAPLLEGNPHISQVYAIEKDSDILAFGKELKAEKFDVALDTQGLFFSGLVTHLSGAKRRVGFDLGREGNRLFLTEPVVSAKTRRHMVDKLLDFCPALGVPIAPPRSQTYLIEGEREAANNLLISVRDKLNRRKVGLIIGASTPEKAWPEDKWIGLSNALIANGLVPVLLGGAGEVDIAGRIANQAMGILNLVGKTTPRVLASVQAQCSVIVGGDSGPTHLAVSVGVPVVGLYGVTDPVRTGPQWGANQSLVIDLAEADAPPETRRARHTTITDAMSRIPVETVERAIIDLLTI